MTPKNYSVFQLLLFLIAPLSFFIILCDDETGSLTFFFSCAEDITLLFRLNIYKKQNISIIVMFLLYSILSFQNTWHSDEQFLTGAVMMSTRNKSHTATQHMI